MAKRSTPSDKIKIDPLFVIPEGAEDQFIYPKELTDDEDAFLLTEDLSEDFERTEYEYDEGDDDEDDSELGIPNDFTIVSQKLRRVPSGQHVVDVVIKVEDIEGAVKYEIQVTKV